MDNHWQVAGRSGHLHKGRQGRRRRPGEARR